MCIADLGGCAGVAEMSGFGVCAVVAPKVGAICGEFVSDEVSDRFDRKLREVVIIFMLAGLMVLYLPFGVSPKYGHVQGGGRSNVETFEWLLLFFGRLLADVEVGGWHEMSGIGDAGSSASRSSSLMLSLSAESRWNMFKGRLLTRFRNVVGVANRLFLRCFGTGHGVCEARLLRVLTSPFVALLLYQQRNKCTLFKLLLLIYCLSNFTK